MSSTTTVPASKEKRSAIVTGSARGIGEAIARRLAKEGYKVCVNDISANKSGIDKVVAEINKEHGDGQAIGYAADVTKSKEVEDMIAESVNKLGPLTVMVANAGIAQVQSMLEISDDDAHRMFDVNYFGVWNCYTRAAKQMIKQGPVPEGTTGYKIIGCASIVAFKPFPLLSHYSASKWAVRGLTQGFAMEVARHKIQGEQNLNAYFRKSNFDSQRICARYCRNCHVGADR